MAQPSDPVKQYFGTCKTGFTCQINPCKLDLILGTQSKYETTREIYKNTSLLKRLKIRIQKKQ